MERGRIIFIIVISIIVVVVLAFLLTAILLPQKTPTAPVAAAAPVAAPTSCTPSCTVDVGKRYVGAASENVAGPGAITSVDANDCATRCKAAPTCQQYVYYKPNKACYLQNTIHKDQPPISDTNFTSGYCSKC